MPPAAGRLNGLTLVCFCPPVPSVSFVLPVPRACLFCLSVGLRFRVTRSYPQKKNKKMRGISTLGGECPRGSSTPESPRGVSACVAFFYFRVQRYTQATQPCLHLSHSNTGTKRQQETLVVVGVVGEGWFGLVPSGFASPGWGAGGLRLDDGRVRIFFCFFSS